MKSTQRGLALITAMLIVAIIAALATSLSLGQQVWLRQTQNLTDLARAERLREGAAEYAAVVLTRDAKDPHTSKTDNLQEAWAQPIPPLPVEGGTVTISITDAQARYNLNNLVQQGQPVPNEVRIFSSLLQELELPPELVEPLLDWLDADSETRPGGAEDLDYMNHDPPYRAANRPLTTVDELRLVKGYTDKVVAKLSPFVVTLPTSAGRRPINVNTADATVLAALTGADQTQIQELVKARDANPFQDKGQFTAFFGGNQHFDPQTFDVKSSYFIVSVDTRIGRIQRRTEALIERPASTAAANVLWYRQPPLPITIDENKS